MTESDGMVPREAEVLLYQTEDGTARVEVRFEGETAWMTRISLAELYQTTPQNITQLIAAIYAEGELAEEATSMSYLLDASVDWPAVALPDFLRGSASNAPDLARNALNAEGISLKRLPDPAGRAVL